MAIPAIRPYSMPSLSALPKNKVSWTPDPQRSVFLIHDMQHYFLDAFTPGESPVTELLENIRVLKAQCAERGIPVIYTAQPGGQTLEQRGLLQDFWGSGIGEGPDQERIASELAPSGHDIVLTKWRYSAFHKTDLLHTLRREGRDQLVICGIYAHIGCLMTACDAFMQDIQPFIVADAVADFSPEYHRMALTYAAERCAVVIPTSSLLREWGERPTEGGQTEEGDQMEEDGQLAEGGQTAEVLPLTPQLVREQVAELLQESPADIAEHEDLIDRGLDSIRMMHLVERWRRSGAEVTFVKLAESPTLAAWWKLLSSRAQPALPNRDYGA